MYEVVSKRSSVIEGSLSIDELNDILDDLAKNMGKQYDLKFSECLYVDVSPEIYSRGSCDGYTTVRRLKSNAGSFVLY